MIKLAAVALLAAVASSCSRPAEAPRATARTAVNLALFVDDREVATSVWLSSTPRPLAQLVGRAAQADTLVAILAFDAQGQPVDVTLPPEGAAPALAAGTRGARLGAASGGAFVGPVVEVARIVVKTRDGRGGSAAAGQGQRRGGAVRPAPSAETRIEIELAGGGSRSLAGDRLAALPISHAPVGDTDAPGWSLGDILAAAGIESPRTVILGDGAGATVRLEGADFEPARAALFIKLNRGGQLRFRRFVKQGNEWSTAGDLRSLRTIQIVK